MVDEISKYIKDKLFFPKIVVMNNLGVIVNETSRKFGGHTSRKRLVYDFEDILSNLQLETTKQLGEKESSKLWYEAGKDFGAHYILIAKMKKPSKSLLPHIAKNICEIIHKNGTSVAEKISIDVDKKIFILEGENNIVCRKSQRCDFFAGIFSGIFSALLGENIEAKSQYKKKFPHECKIIITKSIKNKYIPDMKEISLAKNYDKLNFPKNETASIKMNSYEDFIKFGKIQFRKDGKHYFKNKAILPTAQEMFGFIITHFLKRGRKYTLSKILIECSEKMAEEIIKEDMPTKNKLKSISRMLCAFGWGIPTLHERNQYIIFSLLNPPISKNYSLYQALVINGYLNKIFNDKFQLQKIKLIYNPTTIRFYYSKLK